MFRERRIKREEATKKGQFPLYPFKNLDDLETRRQARQYLNARPLNHIDGESEYVFRSSKLPDRRHTFPDMDLWQRLRQHAEMTQVARQQRSLVSEKGGQLALAGAVEPVPMEPDMRITSKATTPLPRET